MRLSRILKDYADNFRVRFGSDLPADVPSMTIRLQPQGAPVSVECEATHTATAGLSAQRGQKIWKIYV